MFSPSDTIVAIATAPVRAGIGVVRISGPCAHAVARAILTVSHDLAPRHASLTRVRAPGSRSPGNPGSSGPASSTRDTGSPCSAGSSDPGLIDEVVATYFPAPHSYTTEDVVEISAHGSVVLLRDIVRAAIDAGARLAEPGEFTLRAFLNGRLDLVQAEAVADLVEAVTPLQARMAFDQLEGTLTRAIGELDRQLFDLAAQLEASVDFPDEGYHFVGPGEAAEALSHVRSGIDRLLATSATGRVIREGRTVAILGKPNVGKSSLFNHLVGTDRAIVAPGPGTTRDMLRESIDLEGIRLGVVDTAGIRESEDGVEQEGVVRARQAADVADLVVLVLDRSQPIEDIDLALLRKTASARRVVVVNKIDLPAAWTVGERAMASLESGLEARDSRFSRGALPGAAVPCAEPHDRVLVSLKTGEGLKELRGAMRAAIEGEEPLRDAAIVTNVRHETLLRQARDAIRRAVENIEQAGGAASEELVLADIAAGRRAFEEITGRRTTEDVLRRIFERFCIGK